MALNTEERQMFIFYRQRSRTNQFWYGYIVCSWCPTVDEIAKRADERNITHILRYKSKHSKVLVIEYVEQDDLWTYPKNIKLH